MGGHATDIEIDAFLTIHAAVSCFNQGLPQPDFNEEELTRSLAQTKAEKGESVHASLLPMA